MRRFGAFRFGDGVGFYAPDVALSAWLLYPLVVLVHRRRCRYHFVLLAFQHKNRAVSANRRWCFSLMSHRHYDIISSGGRVLPAPIADLVRCCSRLVKIRSIQLISCIGSLALTACAPSESNDAPPILLFNGIGTSPNDVKAVEAILKDSRLKYA